MCPKSPSSSIRNDNQKTVPTDASVQAFIDAVAHPTRRADALVLLDMMGRVTGCAPKMWGPSMVGFGQYHYVYDSGREGDMMRIGFSPRKARMVLYILPGFEDNAAILERLGKHKTGRSCLYVNKLADVDLGVLEEICVAAWRTMTERYGPQPAG